MFSDSFFFSFQKGKPSPRNKEENGKRLPTLRTNNYPHISISHCESQDPCPGSYYPAALPDFCGHGVRNALGMY